MKDDYLLRTERVRKYGGWQKNKNKIHKKPEMWIYIGKVFYSEHILETEFF